MKHIKVFEGFNSTSSPAVITATGDWSKLTMDGAPMEWIHPDTITVTYHANPTPEMVKTVSRYGTINPDDSVDEIMGGDQNGGYLTQRGGMVEFMADSSYTPMDYKNELQDMVDQFNANPGGFEADGCQSLLEDPELELTPGFLSHCKAVVSGSKSSQEYISKYPQYYSKHHPEILTGGDRSRLKIMKPRVNLIFKTV
jgi:hypothetical protein